MGVRVPPFAFRGRAPSSLSMNFPASAAAVICIGLATACSDGSGPDSSPVSALSVIGDNQKALAGTSVPSAITIEPRDANGAIVKGQSARFSIAAGGGTIRSESVLAAPDGTITAPSWTLGKSAVPQEMLVTVGSLTTTVHAAVTSDFTIDLRFFGSATAEQQLVFSDAVARIRGAVVGALPVIDLGTSGGSPCGVVAIPPPAGTTSAVVIYAQLRAFDGIGGILGSGIRCTARSSTDFRTAVGVISLDFADVNLTPDGMKIVALHEMLHVLGFGVVWQDAGLISGFDTPSSGYIGQGGIAGCRQVGGTKTCASAVPLETLGGPGSANAHWRATIFGAELMTAIFQPNQAFSIMTIRSLEDLGYTVNVFAADSYTIPSDNALSRQPVTAVRTEWEKFADKKSLTPQKTRY